MHQPGAAAACCSLLSTATLSLAMCYLSFPAQQATQACISLEQQLRGRQHSLEEAQAAFEEAQAAWEEKR